MASISALRATYTIHHISRHEYISLATNAKRLALKIDVVCRALSSCVSSNHYLYSVTQPKKHIYVFYVLLKLFLCSASVQRFSSAFPKAFSPFPFAQTFQGLSYGPLPCPCILWSLCVVCFKIWLLVSWCAQIYTGKIYVIKGVVCLVWQTDPQGTYIDFTSKSRTKAWADGKHDCKTWSLLICQAIKTRTIQTPSVQRLVAHCHDYHAASMRLFARRVLALAVAIVVVGRALITSAQSSTNRTQKKGTYVRVAVVVRAVRVGVVVGVLVGSARAIVTGAIVVALEYITLVCCDGVRRTRDTTWEFVPELLYV